MEALRKTPFHVCFLISCGCLKFLEFFGLQTNLSKYCRQQSSLQSASVLTQPFPLFSLHYLLRTVSLNVGPTLIYNDCVWSPLIMFTKTHVPSKFLFTCSEWTCLFLGYFSVHDSYQRTFQDNPHNDCQETTFLNFFFVIYQIMVVYTYEAQSGVMIFEYNVG